MNNLPLQSLDGEANAVVLGLIVVAWCIAGIVVVTAGYSELTVGLVDTVEDIIGVEVIVGKLIEGLLGTGKAVGLYDEVLGFTVVSCLTFV